PTIGAVSATTVTARAAANRIADLLTSDVFTALGRPGAAGYSAGRDPALHPCPQQLGPARVAQVRGMIAVAGHQLRTARDLGPARLVQIDDLDAVPTGNSPECLV